MAHELDRLEPLADGTTAFHTAGGERWRHRDLEAGRVGRGYRMFISDRGEQRRYEFGPNEPHDATISDLREQLARAQRVDTATETTTAPEARSP